MGLSMASIVVIGVGSGFVFITKAWAEHQARTQVQQSLRSATADVSRELRLAGACMNPAEKPPVTSQFAPIRGVHSGTTDTITITSNPRCAGPTNVNQDCSGCTTINVDNTTNFVPGMYAFIYNSSDQSVPPGPYGEFFLIQSVAAGSPGTITATAALGQGGQVYPHFDSSQSPGKGSTVWGADQRTFAINTINNVPTLTLQVLGAVAPQALVKGIDQMTIQYVLNRTYVSNPSQCNGQTGGTLSLCVVNQPEAAPSIAGDWQLVRSLFFTLDAQSTTPVRGTGSADGLFHLTQTFGISPRNFVFQQVPRVNWTPY